VTYIFAQILLFCAVLVVFYSARNMLVLHEGTVRRLKQKLGTVSKTAAQSSLGLKLEGTSLKRFEKYLTPSNEERVHALRQLLTRAGFRSSSAVMRFYAARVILCAIAFLFSVIVLPLIMLKMSVIITILTMFLIILIAYFAPGFWVERTYQYRRVEIEKGFPDALDLLLVCIEAGNSFDQALNRVVKPLLSKLTNSELVLQKLYVCIVVRCEISVTCWQKKKPI